MEMPKLASPPAAASSELGVARFTWRQAGLVGLALALFLLGCEASLWIRSTIIAPFRKAAAMPTECQPAAFLGFAASVCSALGRERRSGQAWEDLWRNAGVCDRIVARRFHCVAELNGRAMAGGHVRPPIMERAARGFASAAAVRGLARWQSLTLPTLRRHLRN